MDYDGGYHLVFSNPELMEELVRSFIQESWVDQVDFTTIERVNAKFHTEWLSRREGDIIYKVKLVDGQEIFLYLLLEFQSEIRQWMAVRINTYVSLLHQQLINEGKLIHGLLPPVFPIVLYNGHRPWEKALSTRELIALPNDSPLWQWQPEMRFFLIEENRYSDLHPDNMVKALFLLENSKTPEQARDAVHVFVKLAQNYKLPIVDAMTQFIAFVIELKIGVKLNTKQTVKEIETMLATTVKEWEEQKKREGYQEGREQGREEGEEIGEKKGETSLFIKQLEKRFGPLPEWAVIKIHNADINTIEKWGIRLFDTSSLEEVFD